MPTVRQRHGRTDGRTDGRTTYDSNTALALRASRGKNWGKIAEGVTGFLLLTKAILLFGPNLSVKFNQNGIKNATVEARTDRQIENRRTLVIL